MDRNNFVQPYFQYLFMANYRRDRVNDLVSDDRNELKNKFINWVIYINYLQMYWMDMATNDELIYKIAELSNFKDEQIKLGNERINRIPFPNEKGLYDICQAYQMPDNSRNQ